MSFGQTGFGQSGFAGLGLNGGNQNASPSTAAGGVTQGQQVPEVLTDQIGYLGVNKEAKLQIFDNPWPEETAPLSTSSLLSIDNAHGLLAAGGPDSVIVASTRSVREALQAQIAHEDSETRPFTPEISLTLGTQVSQVAFSSNGSYLVISAQQGGGLCVYDAAKLSQVVQARNVERNKYQLSNGNLANYKSDIEVPDREFETPTDGQSLRALVANPAPELAEMFAIVTSNGQLLIYNTKTREYQRGPNGVIYREGVSSVGWSIKGKALLAGLGDGTVVQYMAATGAEMAMIPRPLQLAPDYHVSAISWLSLDVVILAYSPSSSDDPGFAEHPWYLMERSGPKGGPKSHRFSPFPDVGFPTQPRHPNVPFLSTIHQYHNIEHFVVVASSAAEEIAQIAKSKVALADSGPAEGFSLVAPLVDSRKAALPLSSAGTSTSPVGMAIDLTSTETVGRPIVGQDDLLADSKDPLPALVVLNDTGTLAAWWIVYADALLQGVPCPGVWAVADKQKGQGFLTSLGIEADPTNRPAIGAKPAVSTPAIPQPSVSAPAQPSFGQPSFSKPSLGQPAFGQPAFGQPTLAQQPTAQPAFGAPSKPGAAFGSSAQLGAKQSPWGSAASTSGAPSATFGSAVSGAGQKTFGSVSSQAQSPASPFAAAGTGPGKPAWSSPGTQNQGSPFASSPIGGQAPKSTFGSTPLLGSSSLPASSKQENSKPKDNPFAIGRPSAGVFGSGGSFTSSPLGQNQNPFGQKPAEQKPSDASQAAKPNPFARTAFNLGSTFADQASKSTDLETPAKDTGKSLFGGGFGDALSNASKTAPSNEVPDHEEDMDDDTAAANIPTSPKIVQTTTPQETPAAQKVMGAAPASGGMFGSKTQSQEIPAASAAAFSKPAWSFPAANSAASTSKPEQAKAETAKAGDAPLPPESQSNAEPPLPPNPTLFKPKSSGEEMPPPPLDFTKSATKAPTSVPSGSLKPTSQAPSNPFASPAAKSNDASVAPLPEEPDSPLDDEGSGIDVANELSADGSPESSFLSKSSEGLFSGKGLGNFKKPAQPGPKKPVGSVFDSVAAPHVDFFKKPEKVDVSSSPRSPSPVRQPKAMPFARPPPAAASRSASNPAGTKNAAGQRKPTLGRPQPPAQAVVGPIASSIRDGKEMNRDTERRTIAAQAKAQAQKEAEEQELSDDDDDYYREELKKPIQPTTQLPPFVAHTDYIGQVKKEGVPGQIEVVYRDANSMVDTLGCNLRGIQSFTAGHSKSGFSQKPTELDALDLVDKWTLADIHISRDLREDIRNQLEQGVVEDISTKLKLMGEMRLELIKLNKRNEEIAKTLDVVRHKNDEDGGDEFAALSERQLEVQRDLRRAFSDFHSNLATAEESAALLRARLASSAKSGDVGVVQKVPTFEAIERTISKMTAMTIEKSAKVDVLAAHLHKLGIAEQPTRGLLQGRRSRSGSPFETPSNSRPGSSAKNASPLRNSAFGRSNFTPRGSKLGNSLIMDTKALTLRDSVTSEDFAVQYVQVYAEGLKTRKLVNKEIKKALGEERKVVVRALDDD